MASQQTSEIFSTVVPSDSATQSSTRIEGEIKKSFLERVSGTVVNHPKIIIAVIVLLVIAIIVGVICFYGIGPIGPISSFKSCAKAYRMRNRGAALQAVPEKLAAAPATDAETEKLIAEINASGTGASGSASGSALK